MKDLLHWTPRVAGLLVAAFISIFAADVFSEGLSVGQTLIALAMHLIPTAVVLVVVAIAWRWPAVGGLAVIGVAMYYTAWVLGGHRPLTWILVIAGPGYVVGALFIADWFYRRRATFVPSPPS